jgi:hypothetical protein
MTGEFWDYAREYWLDNKKCVDVKLVFDACPSGFTKLMLSNDSHSDLLLKGIPQELNLAPDSRLKPLSST